MVARNALVIIGGEVQELPSGDTLNGAGSGGTTPIFLTIAGDITPPLTGTSRRYVRNTTVFTRASLACGEKNLSLASNLVATVKVDGVAVGTVYIPQGAYHYNDESLPFTIYGGSYLTVDLSGPPCSDVVLELY